MRGDIIELAISMLLGDSPEDARSFRSKFEDKNTRLTAIRNAIIAGILPLIIATRARYKTYNELLDNWDNTASTIKNHSATAGDLLTIYCVQPWCDRVGYDTTNIVSLLRDKKKDFYRLFSEDYAEIFNEGLFDQVLVGNYDIIFASKPVRKYFNTYSERQNSIVSAPFWLAKEMLDELPLTCGMSVLDLSCNLGLFLVAALVKFRKQGFQDIDILPNLFGIDGDLKKLYITAALIDPHSTQVLTLAFSEPNGVTPIIEIRGFFKMPKFDAVVGNPPYNTPRNSENGKSTDLYPNFIHRAANIANLVCMVTPSRWLMKNHDSNKDLRDRMLNEYGLQVLTSIDSKKAFNIDIAGGVSYFILNRGYKGTTNFNGNDVDLREINRQNGMIIVNSDYRIDDDPRLDIAKNLIEQHGSVSNILRDKLAFGIKTNHPKKQAGIPCLFSKKKQGLGFVDPSTVKNHHLVDTWRVVFPSTYGGGSRLQKHQISKLDPGTITSESFVFFSFNTKMERDEFFDYITSDNVLDLIAKCKAKQHITTEVFRRVPNIRDASLLDPPL